MARSKATAGEQSGVMVGSGQLWKVEGRGGWGVGGGWGGAEGRERKEELINVILRKHVHHKIRHVFKIIKLK